MAPQVGRNAFFESQINAAALIAEINLLLEFISGRSDRTLGGAQQLRTPDGSNAYGAMLTRFFDIRSRASQSPALASADFRFKAPPSDADPSHPEDSQEPRGTAEREEDPYAL
jgi:hypothetical protein